jgi:hypothetical protein
MRHRARKPKVRSVRTSDICQRLLPRQALNGGFGAAALRRRQALKRRLWADHVALALIPSASAAPCSPHPPSSARRAAGS